MVPVVLTAPTALLLMVHDTLKDMGGQALAHAPDATPALLVMATPATFGIWLIGRARRYGCLRLPPTAALPS